MRKPGGGRGAGRRLAGTAGGAPAARGKPAPDIYLAVTRELSHHPERCAAVEDSTNGLRSAAVAGLRVIAIPHPKYPPDPGTLQKAGIVLTSLRELTPSIVAALAE